MVKCSKCHGSGQAEELRMMTIRVPESVYLAVQTAAHDCRTSMNQYCLDLFQGILRKEVENAVPSQDRRGA